MDSEVSSLSSLASKRYRVGRNRTTSMKSLCYSYCLLGILVGLLVMDETKTLLAVHAFVPISLPTNINHRTQIMPLPQLARQSSWQRWYAENKDQDAEDYTTSSSSDNNDSSPSDHYKLLGIPRSAGTSEIKAAFRKLAKIHHPDANRQGNREDAAQTFQKVNKAYKTLVDPESKKTYDREIRAQEQALINQRIRAEAAKRRNRSAKNSVGHSWDYNNLNMAAVDTSASDSFVGRVHQTTSSVFNNNRQRYRSTLHSKVKISSFGPEWSVEAIYANVFGKNFTTDTSTSQTSTRQHTQTSYRPRTKTVSPQQVPFQSDQFHHSVSWFDRPTAQEQVQQSFFQQYQQEKQQQQQWAPKKPHAPYTVDSFDDQSFAQERLRNFHQQTFFERYRQSRQSHQRNNNYAPTTNQQRTNYVQVEMADDWANSQSHPSTQSWSQQARMQNEGGPAVTNPYQAQVVSLEAEPLPTDPWERAKERGRRARQTQAGPSTRSGPPYQTVSQAHASRQRVGTSSAGDIRIDVEVDPRTAFQGGEVTVTVPKAHRCTACHGGGTEMGQGPCTGCQGTGLHRDVRGGRTIFNGQNDSCRICGGSGHHRQAIACHKCQGQGRIVMQTPIPITVPPGVLDGTQLYVHAAGHESRIPGEANGDLYVYVQVPLTSKASSEEFRSPFDVQRNNNGHNYIHKQGPTSAPFERHRTPFGQQTRWEGGETRLNNPSDTFHVADELSSENNFVSDDPDGL